jgi:small GTP-binding protein
MASSRPISILILGNERVGKTSLCKQLAQNLFQEEYSATMGMDFTQHTILGTKAFIWQTSGAKGYQPISRAYYSGKEIYLIVLSNEDTSALQNLKNHEEEIQKEGCITKTKLVIVNKCDLAGLSSKEKIDLDAYCKSKNLPIYYISAKNHEEVASVFESAVTHHIENSNKFAPIEEKQQSQPQTTEYFKDYLNWSGLKRFSSFFSFGTHHIDRAKAVKEALSKCNNIHDMLKIINNQMSVFMGMKPGLYIEYIKALKLLDERWIEPSRLKNRPPFSNLISSGYYRELSRIKGELELAIKSEEKPATLSKPPKIK